jgi:flagellar basal body-associated protein FliL
MSTSLTAVVLALVGVAAVVGVAFAFYLVGRAEDRDRAAEEAARKPPEPEEEDHSHENGRLARERRRPLPPRRPQR